MAETPEILPGGIIHLAPDVDTRLAAALDTLIDLCERMRTHADALEAEAKRDRELEHFIRQLVESLDPSGALRKE